MRSFLDQRLAPVPGAQFADDFLASVIAPSKQLLKLVPQEITANPQFILLDEQQVAYEAWWNWWRSSPTGAAPAGSVRW